MGSSDYVRDNDLTRYLAKFNLEPIPTGATSGLLWGTTTIINQSERYWIEGFGENSDFGGDFVIPDSGEFELNIYCQLQNGVSNETIQIDLYSTDNVSGVATMTLKQTWNVFVPIAGSVFDETITIQANTGDGTSPFSGWRLIVRSSASSNVFSTVQTLQVISVSQPNETNQTIKQYLKVEK